MLDLFCLPKRSILTAFVLSTALTGCSIGVPLEEQARLLTETDFTPATRYAVVARNTNLHKAESTIAPILVPGVAAVVEQRMGITAEALPHGKGSDWHTELARAHDATGFIATSSYRDFMRIKGFEGYVLVTLNGATNPFLYVRDSEGKITFTSEPVMRYEPVFHIVALMPGNEHQTLMQTIPRKIVKCRLTIAVYKGMESVEHLDTKRCADRIISEFNSELSKRLL